MGTRIPASMRTREALSALIEGRLASPGGRSELVELATRLIVEEALEGEVRDALYEIDTGQVYVYDPRQAEFFPLGDSRGVRVQAVVAIGRGRRLAETGQVGRDNREGGAESVPYGRPAQLRVSPGRVEQQEGRSRPAGPNAKALS